MENSQFNKLPPELRNQIAGLVFSHKPLHIKQEENSTHFTQLHKSSHKHPLALTKVCKRLYNENYILFYSTTKFIIHTNTPTLSYVVNDFLGSLKPEAADSIKHVTVKCDAGKGDLANAVGHALLQLQKACDARIKLELSYTVRMQIGLWERGIEEKMIELDSGDLKRSWGEAKKKSQELRDIGAEIRLKFGLEVEMDMYSSMALMGKLYLS